MQLDVFGNDVDDHFTLIVSGVLDYVMAEKCEMSSHTP